MKDDIELFGDVATYGEEEINEPVNDELFAKLIDMGYWPQDVMTLRQREAMELLAA